MPKLKNKILITVDGSDRCLETIRHVTTRKPFRKRQLVLFHVFIDLPDFYWDIEMEPQSRGAVEKVRAWELEKKQEIDQFMEQACRILLDAGFPEETITVKVMESRKGIARDIIEEAKGDYCAVIISRSGTPEMPAPFLGSTAVKVIQNLSFVPVFIAGKELPGNKILVAVDRSEGAERAVDFVGELMGGYDNKVTLLHAIPSERSSKADPQYGSLPQEDVKIGEHAVKAVFDAARTRLASFGFKPGDIDEKIIWGIPNRAAAIVHEAKEGGYSPIVLGRRGLSKLQEFFMGSVSNQVIQLSVDKAVWVVT